MYYKIVAGIDEGPRSRDAAVLAEALAEACDGDLLLVAAFADPLLPFPLTLGGGTHRTAEAQATLAHVRPGLAPKAHTRVLADVSPVRALRRCAGDELADVVVIGSSQKAAHGQAKLGRTGQALLRDLPCGMAVAAAGIAEQPFALRRIVVGVDGRSDSRAALSFARVLASGCGAELVPVAVVEDALPPEMSVLGTIATLTEWDELMAERREKLRRRLAREDVEAELRSGQPAAELAAAAADADLLVVGGRRRGRLDRIVSESTSELLCRGGVCSVLRIPERSS